MRVQQQEGEGDGASVESHTSTLCWLPVCAVQGPGIYPVPQLVSTT